MRNLEAQCRTYTTLLSRFRQKIGSWYLAIAHQAFLNLLGLADDVCVLDGEAFRASDVAVLEARPLRLHLHVYHLFRLIVAVFFENWEVAKDAATLGRGFLDGVRGMLCTVMRTIDLRVRQAPGILYPVFFHLFEAVLILNDYRKATTQEREQVQSTMAEADVLAEQVPANFKPGALWLKAEWLSAHGQIEDAIEMYDTAIDYAGDCGFVHFAACMNERCARLMKRPKLAAGYVIEAERLWRLWGCTPRADFLLRKHPDLLSSHLRVNHVNEDAVQTPSSSSIPKPPTPGVVRRSSFADKAGYFDHESSAGHPSSRAMYLSRAPGPEIHTISSDSGTDTAQTMADARSLLSVELDMRTVLRASLVIAEELSVDRYVDLLTPLQRCQALTCDHFQCGGQAPDVGAPCLW